MNLLQKDLGKGGGERRMKRRGCLAKVRRGKEERVRRENYRRRKGRGEK